MPEDDDGFTLIEAVIALMVMSIAVVALVGALVTMISLSEEHRGHAVAETAARSFGEAVQASAQSSTPLTTAEAAVTGTVTFRVADATTLPPAGSNSYLLVDREVVRLTSIDRNTGDLTVVRAQGGSVAAAHAIGAGVTPLLHCPQVADLTPPTTAYTAATGVLPTITAVEYWRTSSSSFVNRTNCLADYDTLCPSNTLLPECSAGLFRLSISVTTSGDSRLNGISTTTRVLVRDGSS